jgi:hypothetical protein
LARALMTCVDSNVDAAAFGDVAFLNDGPLGVPEILLIR